jgi:hypothetical protein
MPQLQADFEALQKKSVALLSTGLKTIAERVQHAKVTNERGCTRTATMALPDRRL